MAFSPDNALALLRRSWEQGRLAHAYLLSGPNAEDLESTAARLACLVNDWPETRELDALRKRGAVVLRPESKLRQIQVHPVRDAMRILHQSDARVAMKVLAMVDADRLNAAAATAFLKTLEEPPPGTLILLLTRAPMEVLSTILSRCVRVPLFRSSEGGMELSPLQEEFAGWLADYFSQSSGFSLDRVGELSGKFQEIVDRLRQKIEKEYEEAFLEEQKIYGKTTDGTWLKDRQKYYDDLTESLCRKERAALIDVLFTWLGEILRRRQGLPVADLPDFAAVIEQAARRFSDADLLRRLRAVEELRRNLATNAHATLALEAGFLKAFA